MAPRTLLAAAFVFLAALPASAEFCLLESTKSGEPVVYELTSPRCGGGNRFVFTRRYPANSAPSEERETFITDSWPGFMGADEKCQKAAAGAKIVVERPGSIIIGVTLGSKISFGSHQVWAFKKSCSVFRSRVAEKVASDPKAEREDVLKAIGAGESDMGELIDKLIELGDKPKE